MDKAAGFDFERVAPLLLALVCVAAGLSAIHPITNPDFGWHVALGRWMLAHGSVPDFEPFSHTAPGAPMVAYSWLAQLLYAISIDEVGVRGLRFANGLVAGTIVLLVYRSIRRSGVQGSLSLFFTVLFAVIAASRFQLRPHMFNILFFVVAYGALFTARPRLVPRQLVGFGLLTVCWINLHTGAVLFAGVVALHAAVATFEQRVLHRAPDGLQAGEGKLVRLWALAAIIGSALLVSPNHVRIFPYILETGRVNSGLSLEWLPMISRQAMTSHGTVVLASLASLLVATLFFVWRRRAEVPLSRLAVILFVAALPLVSQRFTWTCFVPAIFVAESLAASRRASSAARLPARVRSAAILVVSMTLAGFAFARDLEPARLMRRTTNVANFATGAFPTNAMTFLQHTDLTGNLFNGNNWGGYILFRTGERYPVFVDGRWITLGEQTIRDALTISLRRGRFLELLERHQIEILLVDRGWMNEALRASPRWRTVFENFNSGVYLRQGPSFAENLARCAAYYAENGVPFDPDIGFLEQPALKANPKRAARMHVQRVQLHRFGHIGVRDKPRWIDGWSE